MMRLSAILIAICMLLIAGSVGMVAHFSYDLTRIDAAVLAVATLAVLALMNAASTRARDRADIGDQIADLSRATADLGRKVAEIERRVEVVEATLQTGGDKARAVAEPLAAEIEFLGTQVRQLADSVAVHDRALLHRGAASAPAAASPAADAKSKHISATRLGEHDSEPGAALPRADGLRDVLTRLARKAPSE